MRVTSKGQVTIPKHLRDRAGIRPGSDVELTEKDGEIIIKRSAVAAARRDDEFRAYLDRVAGTLNLGMSTDEYMQLLRGE